MNLYGNRTRCLAAGELAHFGQLHTGPTHESQTRVERPGTRKMGALHVVEVGVDRERIRSHRIYRSPQNPHKNGCARQCNPKPNVTFHESAHRRCFLVLAEFASSSRPCNLGQLFPSRQPMSAGGSYTGPSRPVTQIPTPTRPTEADTTRRL